MDEQHSKIMSFGDHLDDLRRRLWLALLGPVPIVIACLFFGGDILRFLLVPLQTQLKAADMPVRLLATGPAETFGAYLKVAIIAGLLFGSPWVLYQFWLFIAPGLYRHEKRFAHVLLPLSAALTALSAVFLYAGLLPLMLRFFILFGASIAPQQSQIAPAPIPQLGGPIPVLQGDPPAPTAGSMWVNETLSELRIAIAAPHKSGKVSGSAETNAATDATSGTDVDPAKMVRILGMPMSAEGLIAQRYRVSEYVNLVFMLGLVFAVAFQLPVVMLLGGWIGVLQAGFLAKWRKHVVFGCAVVGAVLTPADPISMFMLALPLYVLFEFGLLLMRIAPASKVAQGFDAQNEREGPDAEA